MWPHCFTGHTFFTVCIILPIYPTIKLRISEDFFTKKLRYFPSALLPAFVEKPPQKTSARAITVVTANKII